MVKSRPNLLAYDIDTIKKKFEDMINLGHSKEDVIRMTSSYSKLYSLDIENMKQKIIDMEALGFSREQVLGMLKALPTLYGLTVDTIREKKEFYDSIGISSIMITNTTQMMQGIELSYARYILFSVSSPQHNEKSSSFFRDR